MFLMKKFLSLIKRIKTKVNEADIEFRYNFDKNDIRCNPFISNPNKTFVWVEKVNKDYKIF